MKRLAFSMWAYALVACSGNPATETTLDWADPVTELNMGCEILQDKYIMNIRQIDMLEDAILSNQEEDAEVRIQLTELGFAMGGADITSPEEMRTLLYAVRAEQENQLTLDCDHKVASSRKWESGRTDQGSKVARKQVRKPPKVMVVKPNNSGGRP